jgi:predicted amidohydrolase
MPRHLPPISRYKVAAVQYEPTLGEKEKNVDDLVRLTVEAAENGARLIVHPEMATTGYCWYNREEIEPFVEAIPGPTTERFGRIAREYGCYIVLGMPEVDPKTGAYYNSAPLVGPTGLIGNYRKAQPYDCEPVWAKDGDLGFPVYETEIGNIGAFICMDAVFPETARMMALAGADVLAFPTNWDVSEAPHPHWNTRAWENGCYFVAADRWGVERNVPFSGNSCVISPDGTIEAHLAKGDGIVYGEVDIARARDKSWYPESAENRMVDRRPDTYHNLTLNTYVANPLRVHRLYNHEPLPPGKASTIAAVQIAAEPGDVDASLATVEAVLGSHVRDAASAPDLFVLPELVLGGRPASAAKARAIAQAIPGPATERLAGMARRLGSHIIAGLVEDGGDALYNAAVLVGPGGVAGSYRKVHLDSFDREWATAGTGFKTFNIPAGRVGILLGYDALFPEAARCLAVAGADVIAVPAALERPFRADWGGTPDYWNLWQMLAGENNCYLAMANQHGGEFAGRSAIYGPRINATFREEPHADAPAAGDAVIKLPISTEDAADDVPTSPVRRKEMVQQRRTEYFALGHTPNAPVLDLIS